MAYPANSQVIKVNNSPTPRPWLVWLHGLLGSGLDWQPILPFFSDWPCLTIDLPGHGDSANIQPTSFADVSQYLTNTLAAYNIGDYILVGYSLGGRIAAWHTCFSKTYFGKTSFGKSTGLRGLVLEGVNLGLHSDLERQLRLAADLGWADRFRHQPLKEVLHDWYQQPVFANLSQSQRQSLINYRQQNCSRTIADMLAATSLGKQPWLGDCLSQRLKENSLPVCYLCGENDAKFQQLAHEYQLPFKSIKAAGHNAHRANPADFAHQLDTFLKSKLIS